MKWVYFFMIMMIYISKGKFLKENILKWYPTLNSKNKILNEIISTKTGILVPGKTTKNA